jgi:hypothetical protein
MSAIPPERLPTQGSGSAADLKAALEARRELGPELEDQILESFLIGLERRIDARIDERLVGAKPAKKRDSGDMWVVPASLGVAVPLIAIAGGIAGGPAIVAVMAAVVIINILYFIDRWQ